MMMMMLMMTTTTICVLNWRARKGGRNYRPAAPPRKKIKKHKFATPSDIKRFMRLTLQPKSATEIG